METLIFSYSKGTRILQPRACALAGVVSSGNLEVLIESVELGGACHVEISTAARGFGKIWQAVMDDFQARWQLADARVSINDMGATPAVVSLRLDQAVEAVLAQGAEEA